MELNIKNIRNEVTQGYEILECNKEELFLQASIGAMLLSKPFPDNIEYETEKQSLKTAEEFLRKKLNYHTIPFCSRETLDEFASRIVPIEDLKTYIEEIDRHVKYIDPFNLPKEFTSNSLDSHLEFRTLDIDNIRQTYYFSGIVMPNLNLPTALPIHNHEVTHSQLERNSITNIQNIEIIPIFLELLTALDIDNTTRIYYTEQKFRKLYFYRNLNSLIFLNNLIPNELLIEASYHIISEIKANHLLWLYLNGNDVQKQYIFNLIQKVFDGEITLEYMLRELDITYENSNNVDLFKRTLSI